MPPFWTTRRIGAVRPFDYAPSALRSRVRKMVDGVKVRKWWMALRMSLILSGAKRSRRDATVPAPSMTAMDEATPAAVAERYWRNAVVRGVRHHRRPPGVAGHGAGRGRSLRRRGAMLDLARCIPPSATTRSRRSWPGSSPQTTRIFGDNELAVRLAAPLRLRHRARRLRGGASGFTTRDRGAMVGGGLRDPAGGQRIGHHHVDRCTAAGRAGRRRSYALHPGAVREFVRPVVGGGRRGSRDRASLEIRDGLLARSRRLLFCLRRPRRAPARAALSCRGAAPLLIYAPNFAWNALHGFVSPTITPPITPRSPAAVPSRQPLARVHRLAIRRVLGRCCSPGADRHGRARRGARARWKPRTPFSSPCSRCRRWR